MGILSDAWSVPEVGKFYKDVMPFSSTNGKAFECIGKRFKNPRFVMKNVETGELGNYGPFDWVLDEDQAKCD